jgi:opacity protein-like surface antigen
MRYSPFATCTALFILGSALTLRASGQAEYTANRDYSFSTFIVGSQLKTGLNTTNPAVIFGADATRHFKRLPWLTPSLEVRSGISPGKLYSEETFQGGIKVESRIGRFHPYADFLIGKGLIQFEGGHRDNSLVPSVGFGLDYTLSSRWSLKADYTHQSWDLGKASPTFSPSSLSFGIAYRFNFGKE